MTLVCPSLCGLRLYKTMLVRSQREMEGFRDLGVSLRDRYVLRIKAPRWSNWGKGEKLE